MACNTSVALAGVIVCTLLRTKLAPSYCALLLRTLTAHSYCALIPLR